MNARTPLFLERRGYRRRRLRDAVRLLPVLGLALWMVPLMWQTPETGAEPVAMSDALSYVFGVWALLVALALVLWLRTRREPDAAAGDD